jgi:methylamine dehydrogenase accessory protein MauD
MSNYMLASQLLLWLAVGILSVLVAALARQVGVLHERIAPAGALTLHAKLDVGDEAPAMSVRTVDGKIVAIAGTRATRSQLLFFLSPDCPVCKTLLPIVRSVSHAESHWLDVVLASDGETPQHRAFIAREGLSKFDYVLSEQLGRSFGVSKLPYAVLIDESGRVASLGLINNREHFESLFEAKERNVASIQEYLARSV